MSDLKAVQTLLKAGAKQDIYRRGLSAMTLALIRGRVDVVDALLVAAKIDVNNKDAVAKHHSSDLDTSLLRGTAAGASSDEIRALVYHNANVNAQSVSNKHTPLINALKSNNMAVVKLLLHAKADPTLISKE